MVAFTLGLVVGLIIGSLAVAAFASRYPRKTTGGGK